MLILALLQLLVLFIPKCAINLILADTNFLAKMGDFLISLN